MNMQRGMSQCFEAGRFSESYIYTYIYIYMFRVFKGVCQAVRFILSGLKYIIIGVTWLICIALCFIFECILLIVGVSWLICIALCFIFVCILLIMG